MVRPDPNAVPKSMGGKYDDAKIKDRSGKKKTSRELHEEHVACVESYVAAFEEHNRAIADRSYGNY
mgnify:CR=1 FL=1